MDLKPADQKKLLSHLTLSANAIEELLTAGLTTASEATYQTLAVTFQEASRMKLLRLSSTLRSTHEEITRYVKDDPRFSATRLMFFLNRSWLLCKGIQRAIREADSDGLQNLLWSRPADTSAVLRVVCLGVVKKIAAGAFCAFEFRLRTVEDQRALTWSTVFPLKSGVEIPAEGYLHLPQKQKFTANVFLEHKVVEIHHACLVPSETGPARIQLTEDSTVQATEPYSDWNLFVNWDPANALQRIRQQQVSPFDVDVELQEEIFFDDYEISAPESDPTKERDVYPLLHRSIQFDTIASQSIEGEAARSVLSELCKKGSELPPLFGLMHYSSCRLLVQPLSIFGDKGPRYMTISSKSVDRKALLSALKFT